MLKFAVKRKPVELFHEAVGVKDIFRVQFLLEQSESQFHVDDIDEDGITALQRCSFTGNLKLVQLLVSHGADLNIQDKEGWSVLHAASVARNHSIIRYLITMGAPVELENDQGELAIDLAQDLQSVLILAEAMRRKGKTREVEQFLKRRPDIRELIEEKAQQSDLTSLIKEPRKRATSEIILPKNISSAESQKRRSSLQPRVPTANVKMRDKDQERLMDVSSFSGPSGVELPSRDQDTHTKNRLSWDVGCKDTVCLKCGKRRREVFKRQSTSSLCSNSSDSSSSSDSAYSSTSTNSAANVYSFERGVISSPRQNNDTRVENFTQDRKRASSVNVFSDPGNPPNREFPTNAQFQSRRNSSPATYLHSDRYNTFYGESKAGFTIASAISHQVTNVNELNSNGVSLLHEAAAKGDTEGVKLLLEHGAEVNRQSLNGSSPIHEAVREGNVVTASILIEHGADLFSETDNGLLPVDMAKDIEIKRFIENAMALK